MKPLPAIDEHIASSKPACTICECSRASDFRRTTPLNVSFRCSFDALKKPLAEAETTVKFRQVLPSLHNRQSPLCFSPPGLPASLIKVKQNLSPRWGRHSCLPQERATHLADRNVYPTQHSVARPSPPRALPVSSLCSDKRGLGLSASPPPSLRIPRLGKCTVYAGYSGQTPVRCSERAWNSRPERPVLSITHNVPNVPLMPG
jgi:hypothetical protein